MIGAAERIELVAPADSRTGVWAAGVTYERSRAARVLESEESADVYDRVYAADRPEIFFKSAAWRVRARPRGVVPRHSGVDVPSRSCRRAELRGEVVGSRRKAT